MQGLNTHRMRIDLTNQQPHLLNLEKVQNLTRWLMQNVQQLDPAITWNELSLVLLDDEGITPLNKTYFGKEQPTDVISFAYDEQPGHTGCTGEVMVNVDRAVQEGPGRKGSSYELGLYIAHGCHHLMGASDETPELKDAMLAVETEWLEAANNANLLDNLFTEGTEPAP